MSEYLVRNGKGVWEICTPGVFLVGPTEICEANYVCAWADRRGAFFCSNEDAIEVRSLPE